jgi:hypothetical protein
MKALIKTTAVVVVAGGLSNVPPACADVNQAAVRAP